MVPTTIRYDATDHSLIGWAYVPAANHSVPVRVRVPLKPIETALIGAYVARELRRVRALGGEVGGVFGFVKKAFNKVKKAVGKVAKKVGLTKIAKTVANVAKKVAKGAKAVIQHPAFAAAMGVVSVVVPGGAAIGAGYAALRAAIKLGEGIAQKAPAALQAAEQFIKQGPAGQQIMSLVNSVKATPAMATDQNPWLREFFPLR